MNQRLPIADQIADAITGHTVQLFRFDASLRRTIRRLLQERVGRELVAELAKADPTAIKRKPYRDRNVATLAEKAGKITRAGYRAVAMRHESAMRELAAVEEEFARLSVNRVVGQKLLTVTVPDRRLREIAKTTIIGDASKGATAADWWAGQADSTRKAYTRAVNAGLQRGEGIGEIINRVRGGGALPGAVSFGDAETLVRTSVMAVSNAVHMESYRQNDDIIRGVQVMIQMDGRTSDVCLALGAANAAWDMEGNPLPESGWQYPQPPGPPFHFNCRSILTPVLGSADDLIAELGQVKAGRVAALPQDVRDRMTGDVAASLSMEAWLRDKPDSFVNGLLGKTRAGLWREGKLKVSQLVDQSARPLTLDQLRESVRSVTGKAIEQARAA